MTLRIGVVQANTGIDPAANAATLRASLARLASDGAAMAFTPEMSGLLNRDRDRLLAAARTEEADVTLAIVRETAADTGMWVALGSIAVQTGAGLLANRSILVDGAGAIRARYDKIHRFDVDLGEGQHYRESATFEAGAQAVVADTPWGRLGLSVCYDIRFNALYDALADAGATLVAIPAAFTRPTGEAHWHVLQRARAVLGGAFVIAAAQTGTHQDGRDTFGHSLVVDPWGTILLDMGEAAGEATVDIHPAAVEAARAKLPTLRQRRAFRRPE